MDKITEDKIAYLTNCLKEVGSQLNQLIDDHNRMSCNFEQKKGWICFKDFIDKYKFISNSGMQKCFQENKQIIKHCMQNNKYFFDEMDLIEKILFNEIGSVIICNNLKKWREFIPELDEKCKEIENKKIKLTQATLF